MERLRGSKHPKSKSKLYYFINSTERSNFKKTCKVQGWNLNEFVEVLSDKKSKSGKKRYYYALKTLVTGGGLIANKDNEL